MKYYIIVGEASGDLHASHLMSALKAEDPEAEFRFLGGDLMSAEGGTRVKHYKELAYMGFVPVLLHLPTIFRNMAMCKKDIAAWRPDVVILVDYPGFNLSIAKYAKKHTGIPVYYYISPKVWAWKEWRVKSIKRDVREMFSISIRISINTPSITWAIPRCRRWRSLRKTTAKAMRTSVPGTDWNPTGRLLRSWQAAGSKR